MEPQVINPQQSEPSSPSLSPTPIAPQTPTIAPLPSQVPTKTSNNKRRFVVIVVIVLLVLGAAYLGFLLSKEKQTSKSLTQQLNQKNSYIENNKPALEFIRYEAGIRSALQSMASSECYQTKSGILFNLGTTVEKNADSSIKQRFGIAQYFCNNGNDSINFPIRFLVVKSNDDGKTWQFTYGSSGVHPSRLPNYIYNTDPEYFKSHYNNPSHE